MISLKKEKYYPLDLGGDLWHPYVSNVKNNNGDNMTRSELIQRLLAKNNDVSHQQAENVVGVILDEISQALAKGNRVELRGFGVFSVRKRRARIGRNPKTGASVDVAAKGVPFFKAGKQLRDRLNSD